MLKCRFIVDTYIKAYAHDAVDTLEGLLSQFADHLVVKKMSPYLKNKDRLEVSLDIVLRHELTDPEMADLLSSIGTGWKNPDMSDLDFKKMGDRIDYTLGNQSGIIHVEHVKFIWIGE